MLTDLRYGLAIVMAALAVLGSAVAGHAWYTRQTLYDTDRFVEATMDVIATEGVQNAIADHVTDAVFAASGFARPESVDEDDEATAEAEETDETADEAESPSEGNGLVIPGIAEAIDAQATDVTLSVLQSGRLDRALETAVRGSHEELLEVVNGSTRDEIMIDLDPVLRATLDEMAEDQALSFLAQVEIPPGSARFVVARDSQGGGIWWSLLRNYDDWAVQAVVWTLVLLALAIVISPERDRILLGAGTGLVTLALLNIGLLYAIRKLAGGIFIRDEIAREAFDDIYGSLGDPLVGLEIRIAIVGAVLAAAGGALGFYVARFRGERVFGGEDTTRTIQPQLYQSGP